MQLEAAALSGLLERPPMAEVPVGAVDLAFLLRLHPALFRADENSRASSLACLLQTSLEVPV
jgi:hypothetical protein